MASEASGRVNPEDFLKALQEEEPDESRPTSNPAKKRGKSAPRSDPSERIRPEDFVKALREGLPEKQHSPDTAVSHEVSTSQPSETSVVVRREDDVEAIQREDFGGLRWPTGASERAATKHRSSEASDRIDPKDFLEALRQMGPEEPRHPIPPSPGNGQVPTVRSHLLPPSDRFGQLPSLQPRPRPFQPQVDVVRSVLWPKPDPVKPLLKPINDSDQIYVLGSDVQGRFITHALASSVILPPTIFFTQRKDFLRDWHNTGRKLTLYNGDSTVVATRAQAQYAGRGGPIDRDLAKAYIPEQHQRGPIAHLIITVPPASVVRSIYSILPRITPSTVVCFVQNGLGVIEAVNDACFPNPADRPMYVMGHLTHALAPKKGQSFAVQEIHHGRLYLTSFGRESSTLSSRITKFPPIERNMRISHFINLLATVPNLQAGGYNIEDFLILKLRRMIVSAVLEPLTVVLGCTYGKLLTNDYAKHMIDQLLGEILAVVARLPELRGSDEIKTLIRRGDIRAHVYKRLMFLKNGHSRMYVQTLRGHETDIDFLNGYFIRRGREVGVKCPVNESVILMVKAKHGNELKKIANEVSVEGEDLPFE